MEANIEVEFHSLVDTDELLSFQSEFSNTMEQLTEISWCAAIGGQPNSRNLLHELESKRNKIRFTFRTENLLNDKAFNQLRDSIFRETKQFRLRSVNVTRNDHGVRQIFPNVDNSYSTISVVGQSLNESEQSAIVDGVIADLLWDYVFENLDERGATLHLIPKDNAILAAGISRQNVFDVFRAATTGIDVGQLKKDGKLHKINLRIGDTGYPNLEHLLAAPLSDLAGNSRVLGEFMTIEQIEERKTFLRVNGTPARQIRVKSHNDGSRASSLSTRVSEMNRVQNLATIGLSENETELADALNDVAKACGVSFVLIFLIMAAQLESFSASLAAISVIPLSVVGSTASLWAFNEPIGIFALIGLLVLIGVVVNDAILKLDFAEKLRRSGVGNTDAIMRAAERRIRPMMATTVTTILALSPVLFGFSETINIAITSLTSLGEINEIKNPVPQMVGGEMQRPMSIVLFGGLILGIFQSLTVVPAMYILFTRHKLNRAH